MLKKRYVQVLLSIFIIIAALGIWQKDNIIAYYNSRRYSSEELQEQVDEIRESADQEIQEKYPELQVPRLSAEEEEKLLKGEISAEEFANKYLTEYAVNNDDSEGIVQNINESNENEEQSSANNEVESSANQDESKVVNKSDAQSETNTKKSSTGTKKASDSTKKPVSTKKSSTNTKSNSEEKAVSEAVGKLYALQAKYLSKIGALERAALADYGDGMSKSQLVSKYGSIAGGYESQCDAEVEATLANLDAKLAKLSVDRSVVSTLRNSYYAEKQSKKAYYLSKVK